MKFFQVASIFHSLTHPVSSALALRNVYSRNVEMIPENKYKIYDCHHLLQHRGITVNGVHQKIPGTEIL